MKDVSLKELLEAGCYFGHQTQRWHPKAAKFIYGSREGVHIIDLVKTKKALDNTIKYVYDLAKSGKKLLAVATKRQARNTVKEHAKVCGLNFLTDRWIGGFITNWDEVKKNINKMNTHRKEQEEKAWDKFPKHEQVKLGKELRKLESIYEGVSDLENVPDAVFVVDIKKEETAITEARKRQIVSIGIMDTNSNPEKVDYPIPANDDAIGSIEIIVKNVFEAFREGREEMLKTGRKEMATGTVKKQEEESEEIKDIKIKKDVKKETENKNKAVKKETDKYVKPQSDKAMKVKTKIIKSKKKSVSKKISKKKGK